MQESNYKKGDLVIPVSTDFEVFIYLGKGLWQGWIRLHSIKDNKRIQVRETFVERFMDDLRPVIKCP